MTYRDIRNRYDSKGYRFFVNPFDLNIGGIRSPNSKSNQFDDLIFVAYVDDKFTPHMYTYGATTDPGKYWLRNPMNKKGTLILCPGQYRSCYRIGLHGRGGLSPYKALEQVGDMRYVRDNDKNAEIDFSLYRDPVKRNVFSFTGNCKSNLHRASKWQIVQVVERYSAGCQVIQNPNDFTHLLSICEMQKKAGLGSLFTYTLFEDL